MGIRDWTAFHGRSRRDIEPVAAKSKMRRNLRDTKWRDCQPTGPAGLGQAVSLRGSPETDKAGNQREDEMSESGRRSDRIRRSLSEVDNDLIDDLLAGRVDRR